MTIYTHCVYWIHLSEHVDYRSQGYVGVSNNPNRRLKEHFRSSHKENSKNPFFCRIIKKYGNSLNQTILFQGTEQACYILEEEIRPEKNIGWNSNKGGIKPPSKNGWKPSLSTLKKRSESLKGLIRTEEWCKNLSVAKIGQKNPMYGKRNSCAEKRQIAIIKAKNIPNYNLYKTAIEMMNNGIDVKTVAITLGIGRSVCFRLKNRKHLFFKAFPELV